MNSSLLSDTLLYRVQFQGNVRRFSSFKQVEEFLTTYFLSHPTTSVYVHRESVIAMEFTAQAQPHATS